MWLRRWFTTGALAVTACGGVSALDRVPEGQWGGLHVEMRVTATGGTLTFDCADGTIDQELRLDESGEFSARGAYVPERPGPIREGEMAERIPARYFGRIDGQSMTLRIRSADEGRSFGDFMLTFGKPGRITRCQ